MEAATRRSSAGTGVLTGASADGDAGHAAAHTVAVATVAAVTTARPALDVLALALCAAAFALALAGASTLVLLAPIVLGVPHVVADLRYLVVRGPLRAAALVAIVIPLALLTGQRAMAAAGGVFSPRIELALGLAAIAGAIVAAPAARARRVLLVAATGCLAAAALAAPRAATLVLLHVHNLVGLGLWLAWTRTRAWPIVAAIAFALVAIASGACDAAAGTLASLATQVAPDLPPIAAARIALAFAFLQAVHYIAWLYLVPRALGTRGLVRDFGRAGVAAFGLLALAVPLAAIVTGDPSHVRELYLAFVVFHAWLEVAVAGYLLAARRA